jgi:16S rRNA (uracil1498-N3)-methyltransferase
VRQLVLEREPNDHSLVHITGKQYKYLITVLRLSEGDVFEGRSESGPLYSLRIVSIDTKKRSLSAMATPVTTVTPNTAIGSSMSSFSCVATKCEVILFQWILKGPKMDQVIRQATEAGVYAIVPVIGDRSMASESTMIGEGKADRWRRIIKEAIQQSGSPISTKILEPVCSNDLSRVIAQLHDGRSSIGIVLTEAPLALKSLHEYLVMHPSVVSIAVGPEGGMTEKELSHLTDSGFFCVHFKTNILRAETAAMYGIAAVQVVVTENENWQLKE